MRLQFFTNKGIMECVNKIALARSLESGKQANSHNTMSRDVIKFIIFLLTPCHACSLLLILSRQKHFQDDESIS